MTEEHFDVIIIGSGPGGEGAAMQAAKLGMRALVVERYVEVGGGCTHWGTIPSKALRHTVHKLTEMGRGAVFREFARQLTISYPELLQDAASVVRRQVDMREGFYHRNRVRIMPGSAHFEDEHTIVVERDDSTSTRITADYFVIATGSRPYRPPSVDFAHPSICDADSILELDRTPNSMIVYGAGVIGCEYASIFRNLGLKLDLVNTRDKLLSYLDDEIVDALAYHLRDQGVVIRNSEEYERVEGKGDGTVTLHLQSGKQIRADVLLWAVGRTGNTDALSLDAIGLETDSRGNLPVNANYQTERPHIYAVGDVVGPPALASAAYDQGRFASRHISDPASEHSLAEFIPSGIYTNPEISSIGKTERELTEERVPYEVGRSTFKSLARAQITGNTVGMLKLLFHPETLKILGIHCFGYQAAEIVHIGQVIMSIDGPGSDLSYFAETTFNYPTMAEAYRVAALNGLNRLH